MRYLDSNYMDTLEVKKSKFFTYMMPYKEFSTVMNHLKIQHPKARHFVYAYRYLNEFDQIVENCSDDGEPKGTSGKPSLSVLSGADLINTAVIIVRYFGGIKLGTGGLVKAYSEAVNLVLKSSNTINYVKLAYKNLYIEYSELSEIEYIISLMEINIKNKIFTEKICLELEASAEEYDKLSNKIFRNNILEDF